MHISHNFFSRKCPISDDSLQCEYFPVCGVVIIHSYGRLRQLDPEYAASLDRNDWYRLKRALDICTMSGRYVCVNVCVCVCVCVIFLSSLTR